MKLLGCFHSNENIIECFWIVHLNWIVELYGIWMGCQLNLWSSIFWTVNDEWDGKSDEEADSGNDHSSKYPAVKPPPNVSLSHWRNRWRRWWFLTTWLILQKCKTKLIFKTLNEKRCCPSEKRGKIVPVWGDLEAWEEWNIKNRIIINLFKNNVLSIKNKKNNSCLNSFGRNWGSCNHF